MVLAQLERLQKDSNDLEIYAQKLKKKGNMERMMKILRLPPDLTVALTVAEVVTSNLR